MTDYIWGDAEVTYDDWHGTAQLDQRMTGPSLYELVSIDQEAWFIVGIELGGGELSHDLHVFAVDRESVPEGGDVLPKIAAANGGEIPVTDFLIHNVDPYQILKAITHSLDIRLRLARSVDFPIRVQALSDSPPQD
ncbi:hypothetical protein [Pseudoclavibacter sp. JSM 162008]|uniref:hypothetical protein n=1 Tax=Pseudoclavibacter sp. JSM 162008 TaxID=3229855 RepID=UPI003523AAB5